MDIKAAKPKISYSRVGDKQFDFTIGDRDYRYTLKSKSEGDKAEKYYEKTKSPWKLLNWLKKNAKETEKLNAQLRKLKLGQTEVIAAKKLFDNFGILPDSLKGKIKITINSGKEEILVYADVIVETADVDHVPESGEIKKAFSGAKSKIVKYFDKHVADDIADGILDKGFMDDYDYEYDLSKADYIVNDYLNGETAESKYGKHKALHRNMGAVFATFKFSILFTNIEVEDASEFDSLMDDIVLPKNTIKKELTLSSDENDERWKDIEIKG